MQGEGDVMTQMAMRLAVMLKKNSARNHAGVCLPVAFLEWRMIHEAARVASKMNAMLMPCEGSST
jgi:hypothetical protein